MKGWRRETAFLWRGHYAREEALNLTENEKKIINLYQENPQINQMEIAGILGITQQGVSFLLKGLKKKYIG